MPKKVKKFDTSNVGRSVTIKGQEHTIDQVLANGQKFRVKTPAGSIVFDYDLDDIDAAEGLVIDIT